MELAHLRREERLGLVVAVAAHVALFVTLAINATREPPKVTLPQRMTVSLAEDVGLDSAAPVPAQEAQASVAPTLSEEPAPAPEPQKRIEPPRPTPVPTPSARPEPRPQPRATARPQPRATQKPEQKPAPPKPSTQRSGGGSRIGSDFLKGEGASDADARVAASQIGASERASLVQAVARQLRPYWRQPSGVDVDKLATVIEWDLNPDGTLDGSPRFVSQTGGNDANKPQQSLHREAAIRAIRQAAPFDLPAKYYNGWKKLRFKFDWNLN